MRLSEYLLLVPLALCLPVIADSGPELGEIATGFTAAVPYQHQQLETVQEALQENLEGTASHRWRPCSICCWRTHRRPPATTALLRLRAMAPSGDHGPATDLARALIPWPRPQFD